MSLAVNEVELCPIRFGSHYNASKARPNRLSRNTIQTESERHSTVYSGVKEEAKPMHGKVEGIRTLNALPP